MDRITRHFAKVALLSPDSLIEEAANNLIIFWKYIKRKDVIDFVEGEGNFSGSLASNDMKAGAKLLSGFTDYQKQSSHLELNIVIELGSYIFDEFMRELNKIIVWQRQFPEMETHRRESLNELKKTTYTRNKGNQ